MINMAGIAMEDLNVLMCRNKMMPVVVVYTAGNVVLWDMSKVYSGSSSVYPGSSSSSSSGNSLARLLTVLGWR